MRDLSPDEPNDRNLNMKTPIHQPVVKLCSQFISIINELANIFCSRFYLEVLSEQFLPFIGYSLALRNIKKKRLKKSVYLTFNERTGVMQSFLCI